MFSLMHIEPLMHGNIGEDIGYLIVKPEIFIYLRRCNFCCHYCMFSGSINCYWSAHK